MTAVRREVKTPGIIRHTPGSPFANFNLLLQHCQAHALSQGQDSPEWRRYERSHAWGQGWGTHVPLLASVVAVARPGPVLELGSGFYSTPVLAEMCRAMNRRFYSTDEKADWAYKHREIAADIEIVTDWTKYRERKMPGLAVIFVDNEPGWERVPNIEWAEAQEPEFVVVHDTLQPDSADDEHYLGMSKRLDRFRYRYDYQMMTSCTSVVSNVREWPGR